MTYEDSHHEHSSMESSWELLNQQLIQISGDDEVSIRIPWQGSFQCEYRSPQRVLLNGFPSYGLKNIQLDATSIDLDRHVSNLIIDGLSHGSVPHELVPIHLQGVSLSHGSRRFDFIHPSDPDTIYSLNGAGVTESVGWSEYRINKLRDGYIYHDWLREHGKNYSSVGSTFISPKGDLFTVPDHTIAGGYSYHEMEDKIRRTATAKNALHSVSETPSVVWHAQIARHDLGMFISKKAHTITMTDVLSISESDGIDIDLVSLYQQGVATARMHAEFAHFTMHFGNIEMTITQGLYPTFIKDFETWTSLKKYGRSQLKDSFRNGVFATPYEAARMLDITQFLKYTAPKSVNMNTYTELFENRISAYLLGYFGYQKVSDWVNQSAGFVLDNQNPAIATAQLRDYCFHPLLESQIDARDGVSLLLQSPEGLAMFAKHVDIAIMRIWLALERGDSVK